MRIGARNRIPAHEHLPANKVLWILVVQALAVAPHVTHLPSWILVAAMVSGVWRYHAARRQWRAPSLLLRMLLVGLGSAGIYAHYGSLFGRDPGVAMIILMLALKLLELNRRRDVVLFVLLGYFLVVTNFLYSQSAFMAVYMLAVSVMLTSALAAVTDPAWRVHPLAHLRLSGRLLLQAVPIAIVLFVLFPRFSGPLWKIPDDAHTGGTGLSERMSPGSISRLARSNAVAFRVDFTDPAPPQSQLYWRGPVLEAYDGSSWTVAANEPFSFGSRRLTGRPIRYQVTMEANDRPWLLALDLPEAPPANALITENYELLSRTPVVERLRYQVRSRVGPSPSIHESLSPSDRRQNLQLPAQAEPRTRQLGHELGVRYADPHAVVAAALKRFRDQAYVYTLQPPLLGDDPVDQFLFESRRGFCEHYAGAFTVLMRAAGVPARVVTGYQGGEFNPAGSYWIVRQSDAHAWSEVWLAPEGWVRVDPTAAIAPQRIERGIEAALPDQVLRTGLQRSATGWLRDLGLAWDSASNRWNQWVLGYGPQRQMEFLRQFGVGHPHWLDLAFIAAAGVTCALLILAAAMALRHRPPARPPAVKAYEAFCAKLGRIGLSRLPHEGPMAYAQRVVSVRPDLADPVWPITQLYTTLRYEACPAGQTAQLLQLVKRFAPDNKIFARTRNTPAQEMRRSV